MGDVISYEQVKQERFTCSYCGHFAGEEHTVHEEDREYEEFAGGLKRCFNCRDCSIEDAQSAPDDEELIQWQEDRKLLTRDLVNALEQVAYLRRTIENQQRSIENLTTTIKVQAALLDNRKEE